MADGCALFAKEPKQQITHNRLLSEVKTGNKHKLKNMGWQSDQPPVNYLNRRVIYYKKKIGRVKKLIHNETMINRHKEKLSEIIGRAVEHYEKRIRQFTSAIKKLQN